MDTVKAARCFYCHQKCEIECGHCAAVLHSFGQKHNCPDPDEGFFDDNDFDIQICESCSETDEYRNEIQPTA